MQIIPYLNFDGTCAEAFRFYHDCLGGELDVRKHGDQPMEGLGPEWMDRVLHARLDVGGQVLMASDTGPGEPATPAGFAVALQLADPADAERVFGALSDGGTITLPIQETPWSPRFGMFTDRYGVPWMVNCTGGEG